MKFKKRNIQVVDHSTGQTLDFPTFGKVAGEEAITELEKNVDNKIADLKSMVGTPLKASTASAMNDSEKIYVYTGSESGYTNGHWYYNDDGRWVDGGVYNSTAVETDKTLSIENMPADAKKTGDEVNVIKEDLTHLDESLTTGMHPIDLELTTSPSTRFNSKRFYLNVISLPISFNCSNDSYSYYIAYYKSDDAFISNTGWQKGTYTVTTANIPAETAYFTMICKADDEHSLSDSEKKYYSSWDEYAFYADIAQLNTNVKSLKLSTYDCYVDYTNGNNNNDGTKSNPFKTINYAISLGYKNINVKPDTYFEQLSFIDKSDISIKPYGFATFSTLSYESKIILDGSKTKNFGIFCFHCSNITIEGVEATNFVTSGFRLNDCSNVRITDCIAHTDANTYAYSIGFELINVNAIFSNCVAHDIKLDGFNMHGYGTTTFINCTAYNCGDDGISHHDACVGYIMGGEYYNCGKGGIASPTYGSYIDISGAYCHDNKYGIYAVSSADKRKSKTNISNCASENNITSDIYIDYANAVGWNNQYTTKTVGTNGSFTEI